MLPPTLFQLAGREPVPPRLGDATLVLIDCQNEYLDGPLRLVGVETAVERLAVLLAHARRIKAPIVHVAHRGTPGGLFDRSAERGDFIQGLCPVDAEPIVEKTRPNAFSGTDLAQQIGMAGRPVVLAGFMTHNCVSSTAHAALDLGYPITIAGDACATRDLALGDERIAAADLHRAELAGLADRHACIVSVDALIHLAGER